MVEKDAVARLDRGGRPRDPGNDVSILQAALDLLIERGVDGASIEAIARHAGVAKMTVYRRWQSKDDLLAAALEYARGTDASPPEAPRSLNELVTSVAQLLGSARFRALTARIIGAAVEHPNLVNTYRQQYLQPRMDVLAEAARAAIVSGQLPAGTDPTVVEDVFSSAISFVLVRGDDATPEQITRRLHNLLSQIGYKPQSKAPRMR